MTHMIYDIDYIGNSGVYFIDGNPDDLFNIINIDVSKERLEFTLMLINIKGVVIINAPERDMTIHLSHSPLIGKTEYILNSNKAKLVVSKHSIQTNRYIQVNQHVIDLESKKALVNHQGEYQVREINDVVHELSSLRELIQYIL